MAAATRPRPGAGGATRFQPLADRVVVPASAREERTVSGVVLPDTAGEKPPEGTVVAVGPGRLNERGTRVALEVEAVDTVLYAGYAGTRSRSRGEDLLILTDADVLAVLQ